MLFAARWIPEPVKINTFVDLLAAIGSIWTDVEGGRFS
jgi:hypothetical protein